MRAYRYYKPRPAPVSFMNVDGQSGAGLQGAVFCLFQNGRRIASAVSQEDGTVCFDGIRPGNYVLMETEVPYGYYGEKRSFPVRVLACGKVWIGGCAAETVRICNTLHVPACSAFHFMKYDTLSGARLDGAAFQLQDESGCVKEAVSQQGGHVTFTGLQPGTYVLREIRAPKGYEAAEDTWQVEACSTGYITVDGEPAEQFSVGNCQKSYELSIHKTGITSGMPLAGAIFQLSQNGTPVRIGTTDQSGNLAFKGLYSGLYQLRELQPPPGYSHNPVIYQVDVMEDGTVIMDGTVVQVMEIKNMLLRFDAVFTKTDVFGEALAGSTFSLSREGAQAVTAVSDEHGRVQFSRLLPGTYMLTEKKPPSGYLPDQKTYTVEVEEGGTVLIDGKASEEFRVENEKPGQLIVYLADQSGNPLAGAVYLITNKTGIVSAITTDSLGFAIQGRLEKGTYEMRESVPSSGYGLNPHCYQIAVGKDGRVVIDGIYTGRVTVIDEPARYTVEFGNEEVGTGSPVPGAQFQLTGQQGTYTAISCEDGKVAFEGIPIGPYTLREQTAPEGYYPDTGAYLVTVGVDGTVTIDSVVQNRFRVTNRPYPDVPVRKQNIRGRVLSGAVLEIRREGKAVETAVTGTDGTAMFMRLAPGQYTLTELQASLGYCVDRREHGVMVGENGTILIDGNILEGPFIWVAAPNPFSVLVYKIDGADRTPLIGAEYQLVSGDGGREKVVSDEEGRIYAANLTPGYYVLQEITAPSGYQLDEAYYRVIVEGNGTVSVVGQLSGTVSIRNYRLIEIRGRLWWNDRENQRGMRPDSVTINLMRDGVLAESLEHPSDAEAFVFTDLPQVNQQQGRYRYTVEEPGAGLGYTARIDQTNYTIANIYEELAVTIQAIDMRTGAVFDSVQVPVPLGGTYVAYAKKYAGYTLYSKSPVELNDIRTNQVISFYYTYDVRTAGFLM